MLRHLPSALKSQVSNLRSRFCPTRPILSLKPQHSCHSFSWLLGGEIPQEWAASAERHVTPTSQAGPVARSRAPSPQCSIDQFLRQTYNVRRPVAAS